MNDVYCGDNLEIMQKLSSQSIDLIYADPPFFTQKRHSMGVSSFSDTWNSLIEYIDWLSIRLIEMKRLLKSTGSLFVHCDWHASHYIKIELDKIFGYEQLRNEIIWAYRSGGGSKKQYGRKHDTIFWYSLGEIWTFNIDLARVPYDAIIAESRKEDFNSKGKVRGSVWDISRPPNHSKEWLKWPTQKPEILLEKIIEVHSKVGDVVADFFCGSGTTLAVAKKLNRQWLGCDQSPLAIKITLERMK